MNFRYLLVLPILTVAAACAHIQDMDDDKGPCGGHPACVVITYPAGNGQPTADPDPLRVAQKVRREVGTIAFAVEGANAKDTRITFKCQTEARDTTDGEADCRSPVVSQAQGREQWVVNVAANRGPTPARIPRPLDTCDEKCLKNPTNKCKEQYCTYEYMVQDEGGVHVPLDPTVITDPD